MEQVKYKFSDLDQIKKASDRLREERDERLKNKEHMGFGVPFLDDVFRGIYKNDLIVVGSKTGYGKTQLVTRIAMDNAVSGKKITFFALEADQYEIERRIKYQHIADIFWKMPPQDRPKIYLDYANWYYGKFAGVIDPIEVEVEEFYKDSYYGNLNTFYRTHDFGLEQFEKLFHGVKNETDLVIVDHLHYFDSDDENENRGTKKIVKGLRDLALSTGVPIILVSHVRKGDRKIKQLVPHYEDLHGSSDIAKIATKIVTLGRGPEDFESEDKYKHPTLMWANKFRLDGSVGKYGALCAFDARLNQYGPDYYLGTLDWHAEKFTPLENLNHHPHWAKRAKLGSLSQEKPVDRDWFQDRD